MVGFFRGLVIQGPGYTCVRFISVQVFQVSVFSGVRFFRCPIFQGPHFSTVKFSRGQVFQESGLQGSDLYVVSFCGVRYG